jgi:hypothetical protein
MRYLLNKQPINMLNKQGDMQSTEQVMDKSALYNSGQYNHHELRTEEFLKKVNEFMDVYKNVVFFFNH